MFRKVIRIRAVDSPNVRLALAEVAAGRLPSHQELIPGLLSYQEYLQRRAVWDVVKQCVGLDAEFYQGAQALLYPPVWLNAAEARWVALNDDSGVRASRGKLPRSLGVDPAEGGDNTAWAWGDTLGLLGLQSMKTPNTTVVTSTTLALMREHGIPAERVCFDRGGGGKEHADRLREQGHRVRTVAFGESMVLPPRAGIVPLPDRREHAEERYVYVNRRAQLFWELRLCLDPDGPGVEAEGVTMVGGKQGMGGRVTAWALPPGGVDPVYQELRRQMAPIPVLHDGEGRVRMLPKRRKDQGSEEKCLEAIIGQSPDELDAVVLCLHGLLHKGTRVVVGALR